MYLKNIHISNCDTGIKGNVTNSTMENISFNDVKTPYDVHGENFSIEGTRIKESEEFRAANPANETTTSDAGSGHNKYSLSGRDKPVGAPASCNACGAVFPSRRYTIMNARFFTSKDNQEICPRCGKSDAYLADGLLDLIHDTVNLIQGPQSTEDLIALLQKSKSELDAKGYVDPDAFFSELEAVSPGNEISKNVIGYTFDQKLALSSFLVGVLALLYTAVDNELGSPPLKYAYKRISDAIYQSMDNSRDFTPDQAHENGTEHPSEVYDYKDRLFSSKPIDI